MRIIITFLLSLFVSLVCFSQENVTAASTSGTLTVSVTTTTYNGGYAPKNYVAIWITNSSNTYVKTLMVYYGSHVNDLATWVSNNSSKDKTDAITGATRTTHGLRTATWDGTNVSKVVQVDGTYNVKMDLAEDSNHKTASFSFEKGTNSVSLTPTSVTGFSGISINWVPTNTALDEIDFENQYSVYPNPTKSTAFVTGFDIKQVELITLSGKSIFVTDNQRLDLANLPKGIYLLKITSDKGTYMKKIEKN